MPAVRTLKQSCGGGEISPLLYGRMDLEKYAGWLKTCRNMIVTPQGAATSRPGTVFVARTLDGARNGFFIPFLFADGQNFAILLNGGFFRFYYQGQVLGGPASPYQVAHGYSDADLANLHYVQSNDVITLVHPNYAPQELRRYGNLNWQLAPIGFSSGLTAPSGVAVAATTAHAGTPEPYRYLVTSLDAYGRNESPASAPSGVGANDLTIAGNFNSVSWLPAAGAAYYNVYKAMNGQYGFVGQTPAGVLSFVDNNITPDYSVSPPMNDNPMNAPGDYPAAVAYFEQRRIFAGSNNQPQNVWATQSGTESNMSYSVPSQASDALRFAIKAKGSNQIEHLVQSIDLIAMSKTNEFRIYTASGDALTPSTITIKSQAQNGAAAVQPVTVNNYILYSQYMGGRVREMAYEWTVQGYKTTDLCVLAQHLFDGRSIVDMAYTHAPHPVLWVINDAGALLGLTYLPDQDVAAWHRHDSAGAVFESCCAITENGVDVLYLLVRRYLNGAWQRMVETLTPRSPSTQQDAAQAYFVDCGASVVSAAPMLTLANLDWLEGATVSLLADGVVMPPRTVHGGAVTLDWPARQVQVGLGFDADLETLAPQIAADPLSGVSYGKCVNRAWLGVVNSGSFLAGPSSTRLTRVDTQKFALPGVAVPLATGELGVTAPGEWSASGGILVRQADPLPLTVNYIGLEVALGG